ncbi:hypothetical protein [Streptomyces sp. NPDC060198]|uniref:hypothetical protein n=1 Tax=Streptomyces sp. NPDC060198 TaxID=3347070 RepID=UPI00364F00A5
MSLARTTAQQLFPRVAQTRLRLESWRLRVNQRVIGTRLRSLASSLQALEVAERRLPHTRRALRDTRPTLETASYGSIALTLLALWLGVRLIKFSAEVVHDLASALGIESISRAATHFLWVLRPEAANQPSQGWDALIVMITMLAALFPPLWWLIKRRPARGAVLRHRATIQAVETLNLCAKAYRQQPGQRAAQLRELDLGLRATEGAILRAYRHTGTMPRRSARRPAARTHASQVAGALRAESLRMDVQPEMALPRLGAMLAEIGERCAEGRIGSMLPAESLVNIEPVSAARTTVRESIHVAVALIAAMASAVAASAALPKLGVNDDLRPALILGCAVLAAILVGGWHRVGRLLELVPGR